MIMRKLLTGAFAASLAVLAVQAVAADAPPLLQPGKKTLYQRVLTTPGCTLATKAGARDGKVQPAFSRFYVYERQKVGAAEWLKLGPDSFGKTVGWMAAECTVPWKMQLTLALTNPAGRTPLVFFRKRDTVDELLGTETPAPIMNSVLESLKKTGRDPRVVSKEPDVAVDIQKQFYLLPVLEAEEVFTEQGFRVRALEVASVSKAPAAAAKPAAQPVQNQLKGFTAAVVFVIDSTISMGPYIDRTRDAVRKVYARLEQEKLIDRVKFGLVAYRSSTEAVPGLEYVSKMFVNPSTVKDGGDFMSKVAALKPAGVSSKGFDEDAYAGVMQALDQVNWNEFGGRYLVLITDAGAIGGDDALSGTGLNAQQVRLEAKHRGVAIYTLHLKTPSGAKNHASAAAQYADLSNNHVINKALYYPVAAGDVGDFGTKVDRLAEGITGQVKAAYRGDEAAGSALGASDDYAQQGAAKDSSIEADTARLGHAMALAYLGSVSGAKAPTFFKAWIMDRDPINQNVPTTDVRVLLTKSQLSDLSDVVKKIADAANEGLISPANMFTQLRSVAATMGQDPNKLKQKETMKLSELGLLGEYLDGLPYKSDVLSLDEETWKSMTGLQQEQFIRRLFTKLRHYQRFNADVDRWVSLAEGSDPREHVYPVPLEAMP